VFRVWWCGGGVILVFISLSSLAFLGNSLMPISGAVGVPLALDHACAGLLPRLAPNAHTRRRAPLARGSATCPSAPDALALPRALVLPRSATVAAAAARLCPHDPRCYGAPTQSTANGRVGRRSPQAISQPWDIASHGWATVICGRCGTHGCHARSLECRSRLAKPVGVVGTTDLAVGVRV